MVRTQRRRPVRTLTGRDRWEPAQVPRLRADYPPGATYHVTFPIPQGPEPSAPILPAAFCTICR
jgi:hypothetical protein